MNSDIANIIELILDIKSELEIIIQEDKYEKTTENTTLLRNTLNNIKEIKDFLLSNEVDDNDLLNISLDVLNLATKIKKDLTYMKESITKSDLLKLIGEVLSEDYNDEPIRDIEPGATSKNKKYTYVYAEGNGNNRCIFFKDNQNNIFILNTADISDRDLAPFTEREVSYRGKSRDETEYKDQDIDMTPDAWTNYANQMISTNEIGSGLEDFESGMTFVKIDKELAEYLLNDLFKNMKGMLGRVLKPIIGESNDKLKSIIKEEIRSILKEEAHKDKLHKLTIKAGTELNKLNRKYNNK